MKAKYTKKYTMKAYCMIKAKYVKKYIMKYNES